MATGCLDLPSQKRQAEINDLKSRSTSCETRWGHCDWRRSNGWVLLKCTRQVPLRYTSGDCNGKSAHLTSPIGLTNCFSPRLFIFCSLRGVPGSIIIYPLWMMTMYLLHRFSDFRSVRLFQELARVSEAGCLDREEGTWSRHMVSLHLGPMRLRRHMKTHPKTYEN